MFRHFLWQRHFPPRLQIQKSLPRLVTPIFSLPAVFLSFPLFLISQHRLITCPDCVHATCTMGTDSSEIPAEGKWWKVRQVFPPCWLCPLDSSALLEADGTLELFAKMCHNLHICHVAAVSACPFGSGKSLKKKKKKKKGRRRKPSSGSLFVNRSGGHKSTQTIQEHFSFLSSLC